MFRKKVYSVDIEKPKKYIKTYGELLSFLKNTYSNDWFVGTESTKTFCIKPKKIRGLKIYIDIDYALGQIGKLEYRLICMEKVGIRRLSDNRKISVEELQKFNKTIAEIKKFFN